jgi:hypothetical protein
MEKIMKRLLITILSLIAVTSFFAISTASAAETNDFSKYEGMAESVIEYIKSSKPTMKCVLGEDAQFEIYGGDESLLVSGDFGLHLMISGITPKSLDNSSEKFEKCAGSVTGEQKLIANDFFELREMTIGSPKKGAAYKFPITVDFKLDTNPNTGIQSWRATAFSYYLPLF